MSRPETSALVRVERRAMGRVPLGGEDWHGIEYAIPAGDLKIVSRGMGFRRQTKSTLGDLNLETTTLSHIWARPCRLPSDATFAHGITWTVSRAASSFVGQRLLLSTPAVPRRWELEPGVRACTLRSGGAPIARIASSGRLLEVRADLDDMISKP